jgi:hypothetical protein
MENFATNTFALVVSSTLFDESDYIRDKEQYKQFLQDENNSF